MFNLDPGKLLVIAVVAVMVLGPDKLPDAARRAGDAWRSFNEFRQRMESEVRSNLPDLPSTGELARLARSPVALLNHFGDMGEEPCSEGLPAQEEAMWDVDHHTDAVERNPDLSRRTAAVSATSSGVVFSGDATLN